MRKSSREEEPKVRDGKQGKNKRIRPGHPISKKKGIPEKHHIRKCPKHEVSPN